MRRLAFTLLLISAVCGASIALATSGQENGWHLSKEKNGVTVHLRKVDGSSIKEVRGTTTIKASVGALLALYTNPHKCSEWVPNCSASRITARTSPTEFLLYRELKSPWPIKNRDYTLEINVIREQGSGAVIVEFIDVKDEQLKNDCCTRMEMFKGYWKFIPTSDDTVLVTYQNHFDPGGGFPAFLVNSSIADMPIETLSNMKRVVENAQ